MRATAISCQAFLAPTEFNESQPVTDNFIAYMQNLLEKKYVDSNYLQNPLTNPLNGKTLTSDQEIHRDTIQSYLDSNEINKEQIEKWAQNILSKKSKVDQEKDRSSNETKAAIIKARFHDIPSGQFVYTKDLKTPLNIKVKEPFQLMETTVTQSMWIKLKKVAKKDATNPSRYKSQNLDHPVESVSVVQIEEFITDLNHLSLSPDPAIQEALKDIIIDHQPGDFYDLPTYDEILWVASNLSVYKDYLYFDPNEGSDLTKYAWTKDNSNQTTQPVAERAPRIVNNHPFYDLQGNVWILLKETYDQAIRKNRPDWPHNGWERIMVGGSHEPSSALHYHLSYFYKVEFNKARTDMGFRLVKRSKK